MANKKPQSYYQDGSAVRKSAGRELEYIPVKEKNQRANYHKRRNREKAMYMTLPYVAVLILVCVAMVFMALNYLQVRSSINSRIKNISAMETKLTNLKASNEEVEKRINSYLDLENIYKVATEELGMVSANQDQIIYYEKTESEYVRQNEDIPKD